MCKLLINYAQNLKQIQYIVKMLLKTNTLIIYDFKKHNIENDLNQNT